MADSARLARHRAYQLRRLLATEGASGVADRLRLRAAKSLAPAGTRPLPVDVADLLRAGRLAQSGDAPPAPAPLDVGGPMTVAWVCGPPSIGSGGHTTMFRMVRFLETQGHRCLVYLQDRHSWPLEQHRAIIGKGWPDVRAEVHKLDGGMQDCHAIVATSWQSAYGVMASNARGARVYFVQDFEPAFAPAGSESLLAEATYGFPFHAITAGRWLTDRLREDYAMTADWFDFGCDLSSYSLAQGTGRPRDGVAYYCRPSTPRRAHELAVAALEMFAVENPGVPIHVFGETVRRLPFAHQHHGVLAPPQLGQLYNQCVAGLVLSATNVSLVPHEMLAAGCIPVVNDAAHNRSVLNNDLVAYAAPTPYALATRLSALLREPAAAQATHAREAAASVTSRSWDAAGEQVSRTIRRAVEASSRRGANGSEAG